MTCFDRINRASERLRHVATLPMSLSTITLTGTLNVSELPIDDMRLAMEVAEELGNPYEFLLDAPDDDNKKRKKTKKSGKRFRYQLPLKRNGKSVKLFHNGSVHATGCTSPLEFLDMASSLSDFLDSCGGTKAWLVHFDIQLINTLFVAVDKVGHRPLSIAPGALLRHLGASSGADFDTERHPSVKIPVIIDDVKVATACVFQTGSVSIMGAKRPGYVADAYEMTVGVLDAVAGTAASAVDTRKPRTTTAKQPLVLVDGYPWNLRACCMRD